MTKTTTTFSVSLHEAIAAALSTTAQRERLSPALKIAEIVETFYLNDRNSDLADAARKELVLLRDLRNKAIDHLHDIIAEDGFTDDVTFKTFRACQDDAQWMDRYERYVQGNPLAAGNPRKTNANQTIGSRIKSQLGAIDLTDEAGKSLRGRAPAGTIIQTYQRLRIPE